MNLARQMADSIDSTFGQRLFRAAVADVDGELVKIQLPGEEPIDQYFVSLLTGEALSEGDEVLVAWVGNGPNAGYVVLGGIGRTPA